MTLHGSTKVYLYCGVAFGPVNEEVNVVLVFNFSVDRVVVSAGVILDSWLCVFGGLKDPAPVSPLGGFPRHARSVRSAWCSVTGSSTPVGSGSYSSGSRCRGVPAR